MSYINTDELPIYNKKDVKINLPSYNFSIITVEPKQDEFTSDITIDQNTLLVSPEFIKKCDELYNHFSKSELDDACSSYYKALAFPKYFSVFSNSKQLTDEMVAIIIDIHSLCNFYKKVAKRTYVLDAPFTSAKYIIKLHTHADEKKFLHRHVAYLAATKIRNSK